MKQTYLILATQEGMLRYHVDDKGGLSCLNQALPDLAFEAVTADADRIFYAGTEDGEIFRSEDGLVWEQTARLSEKSISLWSLTAAPGKRGLLFAGLEPACLLVSSDGGYQWQERGDLQRHPSGKKWRFFHPMQPHLRTIAVDPEGEHLYIGIEEGGFLASEDGGRNFEDRSEGIDDDLHTIVLHPADRNKIFAMTGGGLFRSYDQGRSWRKLARGLDRWYMVPMAILPENIILAGAGNNPPPAWRKEGADASIYRSLNDGESWAETHGPFSLYGMISAIVADIGKEMNLFAGTTDGTLLVSSDTGLHWEIIADKLPRIEEALLIT